MAFIETPRFPINISYGSGGGPEFSTHVVVLASGHEARNRNWSKAKHRYDAALGVRSYEQVDELREFFFSVAVGRLNGFRFRDWSDYFSGAAARRPTISPTDQVIGAIGGSPLETDYQLVKVYTAGAYTYTRTISKPVSGTVRVAVDGTEIAETTDWTVDTTTGVVTLVAPGDYNDGDVVTAGYEFDVPCRFDTDQFELTHDAYRRQSASVPLSEIRV